MARPEWPYPERYGYTWIRHRDGLYYGRPYPGADDRLVWLEERERWGMALCGAVGGGPLLPMRSRRGG
jgi:hypothetical protein